MTSARFQCLCILSSIVMETPRSLISKQVACLITKLYSWRHCLLLVGTLVSDLTVLGKTWNRYSSTVCRAISSAGQNWPVGQCRSGRAIGSSGPCCGVLAGTARWMQTVYCDREVQLNNTPCLPHTLRMYGAALSPHPPLPRPITSWWRDA